MKWVICSDIFGVTTRLTQWLSGLFEQQLPLVMSAHPDNATFCDETLAYQAFVQQGGVERYVARLRDALVACKEPVTLLGFSAGGAAAWHMTTHGRPACVERVITYYPGQIRHALDICPQVPCDVVFAHRERHFDQQAVIGHLARYPQVNVRSQTAPHGFMNPLSGGYDAVAAQQESEWLVEMIQR
ncbi:dienelactone hydrolase family protein [Aestuariibacter halophilus]|uniref:Dienelactone hydrolase family protein n=1 Tax=Fluctibacter halophilus TaxID=226011 RepID=A0ABS8G463_9ALTE|nr:dienelactone hydrolase family protein [Aestuariibacter halophilus]MCC2615389.1 dienelactone hydrolase family protein [Aestuariibacter halophilus]